MVCNLFHLWLRIGRSLQQVAKRKAREGELYGESLKRNGEGGVEQGLHAVGVQKGIRCAVGLYV